MKNCLSEKGGSFGASHLRMTSTIRHSEGGTTEESPMLSMTKDVHLSALYAFIIALAMILLTSVIIFLFRSYETSKLQKEKNAVLINYFADNGADPSGFQQFERMSGVERAIIYNSDGVVMLPSNMYGVAFSGMKLFEKILASSTFVKVKNKGGVHLYKKCRGGVAYLNIDDYSTGQVVLIVLVGVIICAGVTSIFYVYRKLNSSSDARQSRREKDLKDVMERACVTEWRRLIHKMARPAVMLDKDMCLVDLNDRAYDFVRRDLAQEGRHILDIVVNDLIAHDIKSSKFFTHTFENEICGIKQIIFFDKTYEQN